MKVAERKQENEENDQIFHKIIQMNFKKDGKMALMDTWGGMITLRFRVLIVQIQNFILN